MLRMQTHLSRTIVPGLTLIAVVAGTPACKGGSAKSGDGGTAADADPTLGQACNIGVDPSLLVNSTTINTAALECSSRLCLLPDAQKDAGTTGALCTGACQSDDDCASAQQAAAGDPNDHRCASGFICMIPTTVGDLCCKRLCVCKDFLTDPSVSRMLPAACVPDAGNECPNIPQ